MVAAISHYLRTYGIKEFGHMGPSLQRSHTITGCITLVLFCAVFQIVIIIKSVIDSAALKKLRRAAGICHSVLRNRCAFRCRAKVAVDSDEIK